MKDSDRSSARTIREIGGEVWAELRGMPDYALHWEAMNDAIDIMMRVLARHEGITITNDVDLPVAPLPLGQPIVKR